MTTDLALLPELRESLELSGRDRDAAEAVASGLRDAKAENTRRSYASAWRRFQAWADAGGHPSLPATPQAVALYLGHLASTGRSMASIEQARAAVSHFHAAAGMQKADNPARHPVVAEAVRGWRNRAAAPRQADALTSDALARVREVLRVPSITTTLLRFGQFLAGNRFAKGKAARLSRAWAGRYEEVLKVPFLRSVVVILAACPRNNVLNYIRLQQSQLFLIRFYWSLLVTNEIRQ